VAVFNSHARRNVCIRHTSQYSYRKTRGRPKRPTQKAFVTQKTKQGGAPPKKAPSTTRPPSPPRASPWWLFHRDARLIIGISNSSSSSNDPVGGLWNDGSSVASP
jgi:hypothetical protein